MFEKRVGKKRFFLTFSMYCHILNFRIYIICESIICLLSQKSLESLKSISLLLIHLSIYGMFLLVFFIC
jgi:hypothetical protein